MNDTIDLHINKNSSLMETNSSINPLFAPIGATGHLVLLILASVKYPETIPHN